MIILKSPEEIEKLTKSCQIVAETLEYLRSKIKPGITTREIELLAETFIKERDAVPAFKGYRGFPGSICASVNEEVIHGIPSDRMLLKGDVIGIDLGVYKDGFYGDAAYTFPVGQITSDRAKLLRISEEALYKGIEHAREGNRISDISHAIQRHVEANGYSVVKAFVGHGIGQDLHEDPQVPNFGKPGHGPRLRSGMTLAIEPMVNEKGYEVVVLNDGWTAVTMDGGLSAHFEHTILITEGAPRILTKLS